MSLLKKLTDKKSQLTPWHGDTPDKISMENSKLHHSYSIDGDPLMTGYPKPSQLDMNQKKPKKYLDNPPK